MAGSDFNFSRRSRRGRRARNAEINVTPLVDVMLVLLIVFMVSAPLLTGGVEVDLPKADAPAMVEVDAPITLSLQSDGRLFLGEEPIESDALMTVLDVATGGDTARKIYLRGDSAVVYQDLVALLAQLSKGGYSQLSLVAAPQGGRP